MTYEYIDIIPDRLCLRRRHGDGDVWAIIASGGKVIVAGIHGREEAIERANNLTWDDKVAIMDNANSSYRAMLLENGHVYDDLTWPHRVRRRGRRPVIEDR